MTARVVGNNGAPVTVATLDDISGDAYVLPAATTTTLGGVKKASAVSLVPDQTFTDIDGAVDAVTVVVDSQNAIISALKAAGIMA